MLPVCAWVWGHPLQHWRPTGGASFLKKTPIPQQPEAPKISPPPHMLEFWLNHYF